MGRPRIVGAIAMAVMLSGCLDDGVPDLQTAPVLLRLDEIIEEYAPADPGTDAELADCPVDDVDELIDRALDLVDNEATRAALAGDAVTFVTNTADALSPTLTCALAGAGGVAAINVSAAPDDIDSHVDALQSRLGPTLESAESELFRGGRFHRICSDDDDLQWCEIAWIDELVLISISITGDGVDDIALGDLEERYSYVLPLIVERFTAT